jgi:hypothetical protein
VKCLVGVSSRRFAQSWIIGGAPALPGAHCLRVVPVFLAPFTTFIWNTPPPLSPCPPPAAPPPLSQDLTKKKVSDFLHGHTAYELIPESGKVVLLDVDLPVRQAFHALHEQVRTS